MVDQWTSPLLRGDRSNLEAKKDYKLVVRRVGATLTLNVDGVVVGRIDLPWALPSSQVGLWCLSTADISIADFKTDEETPTAFIIMQFSEPYDSLYSDVIAPVCEEFRVKACRADEIAAPGLIIDDVIRQIQDARFVIAEISPPNPNVFFEVGYAHAIQKPTILVAEKPNQLPFDVSGFRTLFYENSISGKAKIEDTLRKYVDGIMNPQGPA